MITLPVKLSEHIDVPKSPKVEKYSVEAPEEFQSYLNRNIKSEIEKKQSVKEPVKLKKLSGTSTKSEKKIAAEPISKSSTKKSVDKSETENEISAENFLQQAGLSKDEIDKIEKALNIDLKESSSFELFEALNFNKAKIEEIVSADINPEELANEILIAAGVEQDGESEKAIDPLIAQIPSNDLQKEVRVSDVSLQNESIKIKTESDSDKNSEKNINLFSDAPTESEVLSNDFALGALINEEPKALNLKQDGTIESTKVKTSSGENLDKKIELVNQITSADDSLGKEDLSLENPQITAISGAPEKKEIDGKKLSAYQSVISSKVNGHGEEGLNNKAELNSKQVSANAQDTLFFQETRGAADEKFKISLLKEESPVAKKSVEDGGNLNFSKNLSEPLEISIKSEEETIPDSSLAKKVVTQVTKKIGSLAGISTTHKEISFKLYPRELGSLHLNIQSEMQNVKISIVAESNATKQILESNITELKKSLSDQGITTEQLTISVGNRDEGAKEQRNFHQAMSEEPELVNENKSESRQEQVQTTGKRYFVNKNSVNIVA